MLKRFENLQVRRLNGFLTRNLVSTTDIKLAKSHGDYDKAEVLFNEIQLQKPNGKINKYAQNTMISVYGKQHNLQKAVSTFNGISSPDSISISSVFHALMECKYDANSSSSSTDEIDNIAWNIFENHSKNLSLIKECVANKIAMSAMFDLFVNGQQDQIKKN